MRAAIYLRVPMADGPIAKQRDACLSFAVSRGYGVVVTLADRGVSGVTLERPALSQLRGMIGSGQIDAIIVATLDRLARRADHLHLLGEECAQQGVAVCVVEQE